MQINEGISVQLSQIMDSNRYIRSFEIPAESIQVVNFNPNPLLIYATIEGSQGDSYNIIIDENRGIHHDCPDFFKRKCFCKHLGRFTSLLPIEFQEKIIRIFQELPKKTKVSVIEYHQHKDNNHSFDELIKMFEYMISENLATNLMKPYFSEQVHNLIRTNPLKFLKYLDTHPNLQPSIIPIIYELEKPFPNVLEQQIFEKNISDELRTLISEILYKIEESYAVKCCKRKFKILL